MRSVLLRCSGLRFGDDLALGFSRSLNNASLSDLPASLNAVQKSDEQLDPIVDKQDAVLYGISTHEAAPETAETVATAFNALIEDGTYAEILAEWDLEEVGAIEEAEVNPSVEASSTALPRIE